MRTLTFIICIAIWIVISGCATDPRYYFTRNNIEKVPCFGDDAVRGYYRGLVSPDELKSALNRVNAILVKGMYPFVFEYGVNKDGSLKCSEYEKKEGREIAVYVSLFSQSQIKETPAKETPPKETPPKETPAKETPPKETPPKEATSDNPLSQQVQLVVSSYMYSLNPSNRLEKVYTLVIPLHPGVEFVRIKGIENKKLIKFGTATETATLGASIGVPVPVGTVQLSPSVQRVVGREIVKAYAFQNAEIFPLRNILLISQDGGPAGAEIGGNSIVEATIKIPSDLCQYLTMLEIETNSPEGLKIKTYKPICYVDKVPALVASVAVARIVDNGRETVKEDDDIVTPTAFRNTLITDLWRNPEPLFGVKFISGGLEYPVILKGDPSKFIAAGSLIAFRKLEDAVSFRNWLSAGGSLKVKFVGDKCKEVEVLDPNLQKLEGVFQVCIIGTALPDLSSWDIPKPLDLCGGCNK